MTIFSQIMGMKLNMTLITNLPATYAYSIYLVSGLLAWQLFANTLQNMTSVYQTKAVMIRKLPLSLTWLPLYIPITELVPYVVSMLLFTIYLLFLGQYPTWQHLWAIPILLSLICFAYALGLIAATLTVFVPDVRRAVALLLQLLFWGTPIVYVVNILPNWAGWIINLNPVYWGVANMQRIYLGTTIDINTLCYLVLLDGVLFLLAYWLGKHLESDIRDLI
jgi:lipopolysaccharide transport system permease protein